MAEKVIAKHITGEETLVDKQDLTMSVNLYAVVVRDEKVLISPQWKENGYDFPGGSLELGENHIDGLVREVKEETGFIVKPLKVIDIFTSFFMHPRKKKPLQTIKIYYAAEIVSGEIAANFSESELSYAREARFATFEEIKNMEFMCTTQEPLGAIFAYLEKEQKELLL